MNKIVTHIIAVNPIYVCSDGKFIKNAPEKYLLSILPHLNSCMSKYMD